MDSGDKTPPVPQSVVGTVSSDIEESLTDRMLNEGGAVFDRLKARWQSTGARRGTGTILVVMFVGLVALVELARRGLLPSALATLVPRSHFVAIGVVFSFLLVLEVAGLVFALASSVAEWVGKQFELLALILIREVFVELGTVPEPLVWAGMGDRLPHIAANMVGALIVFALLVPFYRIQRHRTITTDGGDQARFVRAKKTLALAILGAFAILGAESVLGNIVGRAPFPFLASFYTILVLGDVVIVLVSLRYSTTFHIVFRNSAFAGATVLVRLALSAPPYVNVLLATGATLFLLATTFVYNAWWEQDRVARK